MAIYDELDITPEMIEAGAAVLWNAPEPLWLGPTSAECYAEQIIRAALVARRLRRAKGGEQDRQPSSRVCGEDL